MLLADQDEDCQFRNPGGLQVFGLQAEIQLFSKVEYNHVIMNFPNFSFQDISLHIHVMMSYFALDYFNSSLGERGAGPRGPASPPGKEPGMTEVRDAVMRRWLTSDILDAGKADLGHEASGAPAHKAAGHETRVMN